MDKKCSRVCHYLSAAWLAACGIMLLYLSVYGDAVPSSYKGKMFGILCCLAMMILSVISYAGGELYWMDIPAGENARRAAVRMILVFLAGTAAQVLYAMYAVRHGRVSLVRDSIVTSGIFCAAAMAARGSVLHVLQKDNA